MSELKAQIACSYCHKKTDAHGAHGRGGLCKACYERLLRIKGAE